MGKSWWQAWASFRWSQTSLEEAHAAEARLIDRAGVPCHVQNLPVGRTQDETVAKGYSMHSISAGGTGPPVVFMPGYAAGAAFFFRNLLTLSQHLQVHLVDWLGTGCSGRPPFLCRSREATEAWFVDSLERWREAAGLHSMVLVGHSLGGYLAANYALRFPERVQHLILINPAGMAEKPADWEAPERVRSAFTLAGMLYRVAKFGWHCGVTPGAMVRTCGPFARRFTRGYAERRMHSSMGLPQDECDLFEPYMHQTLGGRGSGEYALRWLLKPFAWAQSPMEHRMDELQPPVTYIYGTLDWMDPAAAMRICARLKAQPASQHPGVKHANDILYVEKAGHFPFLEKPGTFDAVLLDVLAHNLGCEKGAADAAARSSKDAKRAGSVQGASIQEVEAAFVEV